MDVGPGDLVLCVSVADRFPQLAHRFLSVGTIYTVQWTGIDSTSGHPIVRLEGVDHDAWLIAALEAGFDGHEGAGLHRFVPVRKPPIDAIKALLTQPIPADAESVPA